MFGHHESAQATVLLAEDVTGGWEDVHHVKIEFVLEVRALTGQVFRAKAKHHFIMFTHYPQVGDVVNVKYNPKSLEVELDLKDDIRYGEKRLHHDEQAQHQAEKARRDALLSAPPGTPLSSGSPRGGARMAPLDPELQALMDLEEAERGKEPGTASWWATLGAQVPAGFVGTASPVNPQAALAQVQMLHRELEHSGASGKATILRKQQTGEPIEHFAPFFVEAQVQPDAYGSPFACSFTTWIDTRKGTLTEGYTLPVKYDPQNTTRMVFHFLL